MPGGGQDDEKRGDGGRGVMPSPMDGPEADGGDRGEARHCRAEANHLARSDRTHAAARDCSTARPVAPASTSVARCDARRASVWWRHVESPRGHRAVAHVTAAPAVSSTGAAAAVVRQQVSRDDRLMRALLALIGLYLVVTLALPLGIMLAKSFQDSRGAFAGLANYAR
jgi:hypothetical protein